MDIKRRLPKKVYDELIKRISYNQNQAILARTGNLQEQEVVAVDDNERLDKVSLNFST